MVFNFVDIELIIRVWHNSVSLKPLSNSGRDILFEWWFPFSISESSTSSFDVVVVLLLFAVIWSLSNVERSSRIRYKKQNKYFSMKFDNCFTFSNNRAWSFSDSVWSTRRVNVFEIFSFGNNALSNRWYILNQNLYRINRNFSSRKKFTLMFEDL